ncbi:MAG: hypothetical protein IKT32_01550 [Clostridia bacterium]|nr:hypothetical protein [Clostridia bacterium]
MNIQKRKILFKIIISTLLILTSLFASSCLFDPDEAVNIRDYVTENIVVQTDSTIFYFYYNSDEHPIEDYEIIKVKIEYYVDYYTRMKRKEFFIYVPDDVKYEEETYFIAEIDDALTNQSVVYLSVLANYKTESKTRDWIYIVTIVIAVLMWIIFSSVYTLFCDALYSNSALPSCMWLGSIIIYGVVALLISGGWGAGPAGIIIGSAVLYFFTTLITYFKYKL